MANDYYKRKLDDLKPIDATDISPSDLAERVYYMYLAQQEQINALQQALADAKLRPSPQPMSAGDGDDPCRCPHGPDTPPWCPPICISG